MQEEALADQSVEFAQLRQAAPCSPRGRKLRFHWRACAGQMGRTHEIFAGKSGGIDRTREAGFSQRCSFSWGAGLKKYALKVIAGKLLLDLKAE